MACSSVLPPSTARPRLPSRSFSSVTTTMGYFGLIHELHLGHSRCRPALSVGSSSPSHRLTRRAAQSEPPQTEEQLQEPDSYDGNSQTSTTTESFGFPEFPTKDLNRRVALVSTVCAVGLFLSSRLDFGVSLKDLAANAVSYDVALSNGKPTVVEFYADWCEVCRELAPDLYKVEQMYKDRVNFVMLNVDNTRWEQELDEFGVEGIPHFAFLDREGNEEGNVVGRFPKQFFLENVAALADGQPTVPHTRVIGQFSSAQARKIHQVADPRSHGQP